MPHISEQLVPLAVTSPIGGIFPDLPPYLVPDNGAVTEQNVRATRGGTLKKLDGYAALGFNLGLAYNGSTQSASRADAAQAGLDIVGSITIEAIIRPTVVAGNQVIAAKWGNGIGNQSYRLMLVGDKLRFTVGNGVAVESHTSTTPLVINTTYRVKGTWNAIDKELVTYINGVQEPAAITTALTAIVNGAAAFRLGADNSGAGDAVTNYFSGVVSYVRASAAAEVDSDEVSFVVGASVVGLWRGTLNSTTLLQDDSGLGNHLTLNGLSINDITADAGLVVPPVLDVPESIYQFDQDDGAKTYVLTTATKVYVWDISYRTWRDVTDGTLSGALRPLAIDQFRPANHCVIVNGVDAPRRLNANPGYLTTLAGMPAGFTATLFRTLAGRGVFINYYDAATATWFPTSVAWTPVNAATSLDLSTNALRVAEVTDDIIAAEPLGPNMLVLYSASSMTLMQASGRVVPVWQFNTLHSRNAATDNPIGCAAPLSIANIGQAAHIFLGRDNVYIVDGTLQAVPLMSAQLSALLDNLNDDAKYLARGVYYGHLHEYWLLFPESGGFPTRGLIYNTQTKAWYGPFRNPGVRWSMATMFQRPNPPTWDELVGTWDDQVGTWDDPRYVENVPRLVLGDSLGNIYEFASGLRNFGSAAIDSFHATKEFRLLDQKGNLVRGRWLEFEMAIRGSGVMTIDFSADGGATFANPQTFDLSSTYVNQIVYPDVEALGLVVRIRNAVAGQWWECAGYVARALPSTRL